MTSPRVYVVDNQGPIVTAETPDPAAEFAFVVDSHTFEEGETVWIVCRMWRAVEAGGSADLEAWEPDESFDHLEYDTESEAVAEVLLLTSGSS